MTAPTTGATTIERAMARHGAAPFDAASALRQGWDAECNGEPCLNPYPLKSRAGCDWIIGWKARETLEFAAYDDAPAEIALAGPRHQAKIATMLIARLNGLALATLPRIS